MITSMIQPMKTGMITSMIRSSVTGRWFIALDPVAASYYAISSPIALSGDFEITVEFSASSVSPDNNMLNFGDFLVRLQSDTEIRVWNDIAASNAAFTVAAIGNKLRTLKIIGNTSSTSVTIELDGVSHGPTSATNVPNFSGGWDIGRWSSGNYFDGIIANVSINDIAGGEVTTFELNEPTANYELSVENVFGSDTWVPFTSVADWVDNGGGSYSRTNSSTAFDITYTATDYTLGDALQVTVTIDALVASGFVFGVQGGTTVSIPQSVGTHTILCIAGASGTTRLRAAGASAEGTVSNISIKSVTNAVTYNNISAGIREFFTLVDDGVNWLGADELVVNGGFDSDTAWTKTGGCSIAGGVGIVDGSGGSSLLFQDALTTDLAFRSAFSAAVSVSDADNDVINNSGATVYNVVDGANTFDWTSTDASGNFIFKADGGEYNVDNVTIKRLIEIA